MALKYPIPDLSVEEQFKVLNGLCRRLDRYPLSKKELATVCMALNNYSVQTGDLVAQSLLAKIRKDTLQAV